MQRVKYDVMLINCGESEEVRLTIVSRIALKRWERAAIKRFWRNGLNSNKTSGR
jgi:hypothetical protein